MALLSLRRTVLAHDRAVLLAVAREQALQRRAGLLALRVRVRARARIRVRARARARARVRVRVRVRVVGFIMC